MEALKGKKGIIFDYGGTLDTGGDHWSEVIWTAWQNAGVAVDKAEFREAYVNAERELAKTRHILPEHDFHDLLKIKMQLELQWLSEHGFFPPAQVEAKAGEIAQDLYQTARDNVQSAIPVLEELSKDYRLALVSNFYGNIRTVLADFGILKYFPQVIESAVVGIRKPDPKIFEKGAEAIGLKPEEVVVVGDSYEKDIVPAKKAGMEAVLLRGKSWEPDPAAEAYAPAIASLSDLI